MSTTPTPLVEQSIEMLREAMAMSGLKNAEQLADLAGVSASSLRKVFARTNAPTLDTIENLMTAMGFEVILDFHAK